MGVAAFSFWFSEGHKCSILRKRSESLPQGSDRLRKYFKVYPKLVTTDLGLHP
jgi:hypothetical protein